MKENQDGVNYIFLKVLQLSRPKKPLLINLFSPMNPKSKLKLLVPYSVRVLLFVVAPSELFCRYLLEVFTRFTDAKSDLFFMS